MSFFPPTFTEGRFVRMEGGRLVLYERNGIWQARIKPENGPYLRQQAGRPTGERLFRTQKREGFSANTLCQTVNAIYRQAGLDGATSHTGRRTFITTLASKGVGVRVLAALAGHRSLSSTLVYIDANDDMKRAAVELVAG